MSSPSPAQLLAAVLRVVDPPGSWAADTSTDLVNGAFPSAEREIGPRLDPASKDDLARVVAMLRGDQVGRFNDHLAYAIKRRTDPSAILTAPTSLILAAIVAATGVKA